MRPWASRRHRIVSEEPFRVDPGLLGRPLSSFRRRSAAFLFDLVIFGLVGVLVLSALSALSFHGDDPDFFGDVGDMLDMPVGPARTEAERDLLFRLMRMMSARDPDLLEPAMAEALAAGDRARFREAFDDRDVNFVIVRGASGVADDGEALQVSVGTDVLLGCYDTVFSWAGALMVWFTLTTRLGRGRTPGKRLFGLCVTRLDGRPLGWWDCFGRAGSYGASAATFMLGFLEAVWDPNRQALHDRVAGTVVVRT